MVDTWLDVNLIEKLTEGSQEDREKYFVQKGDCLYRCVDSMGNEKKTCILINEELIKSDEKWYREQRNAEIDMEMACKYQKVLEERFYKVLLIIERLEGKVKHFLGICREKEHPEFRHKEEDRQQIRDAKAKTRADVFSEYCEGIFKKIIDKFEVKGYETSFLEDHNQREFFLNNMLYNCRKEEENIEKQNHISNVVDSVNGGIKAWCEEKKIKEVKIIEIKIIEIKKIGDKDIDESRKRFLKREARKKSCEFIFLPRKWGMKLWMELISSKFYKEIRDNKPKLDIDREKNSCGEEKPKSRNEWIRVESKKWFVEKGDRYTWQLTEAAVMKLEELKDQEKRMDLLNYTIKVNLSILPEMNMIITHSDEQKQLLDMEIGYGAGSRRFTKTLQHEKVKDIYPYVVCLAWKKSNVSFERVFQIAAIDKTNKDRKVMDAYSEIQQPKNLFDAISLGIDHMEAKPDEKDFWYMPRKDAGISSVDIELIGSGKIKCTVEYSSFIVEPLVMEIPYSKAMELISKMNEEKIAEMLDLTEFETKEALIKHCADMVVRNYCKEFLGIPYELFQEVKCYANLTITIHPLIFCKPDGKREVGYVGFFKRNQGTRFAGDGYIAIYEEQVWQAQEALDKDWEDVKGKIGMLLKEKWLTDYEQKKYYSEYAMSMTDFFEYNYEEPYIVGENDAERIKQKILSGHEIHW